MSPKRPQTPPATPTALPTLCPPHSTPFQEAPSDSGCHTARQCLHHPIRRWSRVTHALAIVALGRRSLRRTAEGLSTLITRICFACSAIVARRHWFRGLQPSQRQGLLLLDARSEKLDQLIVAVAGQGASQAESEAHENVPAMHAVTTQYSAAHVGQQGVTTSPPHFGGAHHNWEPSCINDDAIGLPTPVSSAR